MNKEELVTGGIIGLIAGLLIGSWAIILVPACSVLWALGGSEHKAWRRLGVPLIIALVSFSIKVHWWAFLSIPAGFGVLSIGYGIPSDQPPDEGSDLGRFFYSRWPKYADLMTRGTIYLLFLTSMVPTFL